MGPPTRRRRGLLLGALLSAFAIAACSGGTPTSAPSPSQSPSQPPSPSPSTSPSTSPSPVAVDARLLPPVTSSSVESDDELEGLMDLRLKAQGVCATLRNPAYPYKPGPFVRWPAGYRVVGGDPLRIQDARGRFVAHEGDYLWLRGEAADVARSVVPDDVRCPMPGARSFEVTDVSEPGRPFGVAKRPVMVMGWCDGRPMVRPESLMLACDGGKSLNDIRWTSWEPSGATGTARLFERCYNPFGSDDMQVTFTYPRVERAYRLRLLDGLRIDYPREPCS